MDTTQLYTQLLRSKAGVPPGMQRAALAAALRTDNTRFLTELVQLPDAPADLLALYATFTEPEVRAAFLARGDGAGQRMVETPRERRAGVLAKALANCHPHRAVPPHIALDAIAAFDEKPTLTLARALASHPQWLTPAQATSVMTALAEAADGTQTPDGYRMTALMARMGEQAVTEFLGQVTSPRVISAAVLLDLPARAVLDATERAVDLLTRRIGTAVSGSSTWVKAAGDLAYHLGARPAAELPALKQVLGAANWHGYANHVLASVARVAPRGCQWEWDTTPAQPPLAGGQHRPVARMSGAEMQALAAGTDLVVLGELVQHVLAKPATGRLVGALLANPRVTTEQRHRITDAVEARFVAGETLLNMELVNVTALPVVDDYVIAAWTRMFPAKMLDRHGWSVFAPNSPADVITRSAASADSPRAAANDKERHTELLKQASETGVPAAALPQLAVRDILAMIEWHRQVAEDSLSVSLKYVLDQHLGSDPGAWELFGHLLEQFPGTLGELLATCKAVMA